MLNWADQLIQEYTVGQLDKIKRADQMDRKNPIDRNDLTQINSMIDSMAFSIEWMATGRQPETNRGVEKRAIFQKQSSKACTRSQILLSSWNRTTNICLSARKNE